MPAPLNIQAELAAMQGMTPKQLREKYEQVFGEPTRSGNRRFLTKRLAWRMQANAEGGLPERVRRKALEIARDSDLRTTIPRNPRIPRTHSLAGEGHTVDRSAPAARRALPAPGTQITRSYKGRTVVVTVLADGFEHAGKRYRSLSAAAKAITGTHVSGHAFFGLTKRRRPDQENPA